MEALNDIINKLIAWFKGFNLSADNVFLIIILIFLLIGFIKGAKKGLWKSSFYAITTPILITIAFFISPMITEYVKTADLTWLNVNINGQPLHNLMELPTIIETAYPEIGQYLADSGISLSIIEIVFASVTLSVFLNLVWLIWLFGWIIQGIFYHLLFKHLIPKKIRNKKLRLFGGLFGALRALITICVMLLPMAATDTISRIVQYQPQNEIDKIAMDATKAYGDSFIGQLMNGININGVSLNQSMLNYLTKMKVNNQQTSLNEELIVFARTYKIVEENGIVALNGGSVNLNYDNLTSDVIDDIVDALFDSKIVGHSVGDLMIIALNGAIDQGILNVDEDAKEEFIDEIKTVVDWKNEIKHFVEIYKELVDDNGEFISDFFTILDDDVKVNIIADNISQSIIFKSAFPFIIEIALTSLETSGGQSAIELSSDQKEQLVSNIKEIDDFKKEILSLVTIIDTLLDDNHQFPSDFMEFLKDDEKVETIASSIDDSVIITTLVPILIDTALNSSSLATELSNFGVDLDKIDLFDEAISWGNELVVISSVLTEVTDFDPSVIVKDDIINLVDIIKESQLIAPQLPGVVDSLVNELTAHVDLSLVENFIDLSLLAGLMEYDIENNTSYFDVQLDGILTLFESIKDNGMNYTSSDIFIPILKQIRDLENEANTHQDIVINKYQDGEVVSNITGKPTIFVNRALEQLVRTIAEQDFVEDIIGSSGLNNLNYDSLYNDVDELDRIGEIIDVLLTNNSGNILDGNDSTVANTLNLLSSSELLKPVMADLIETQVNTLLGPSRTIEVTTADLDNIDWNDELAAIRYLQNDFLAGTSYETLNAASFELLFSAVRETNIVHKVVVNELNNYTTSIGAAYTWSKDTLTSRQSATIGKLMDYNSVSVGVNDRAATVNLVASFGIFDDDVTYDKALVDAILPAFLSRVNNGHTLDKTVFENNPSYTEAANDLQALINAITLFESNGSPENSLNLGTTINNTNDLASELILLTGVSFNAQAISQPLLEGMITNTRLLAMIHYV